MATAVLSCTSQMEVYISFRTVSKVLNSVRKIDTIYTNKSKTIGIFCIQKTLKVRRIAIF